MLLKLQRGFSWIGLFFIFLYVIYVGGYSDSPFFEYSLVIGLGFLTIDLIIYIVNLMRKKA